MNQNDSNGVMVPNRISSCKTYPMRSEKSLNESIRYPLRKRSPDIDRFGDTSRPAKKFMSVVLPEPMGHPTFFIPDGPRRAVNYRGRKTPFTLLRRTLVVITLRVLPDKSLFGTATCPVITSFDQSNSIGRQSPS